MKEQKITAFIGTWACLILANTSETETLSWFWLAFAGIWLIRYTYLKYYY